MTYILHIETATKVCSVAISKNGELLSLIESNDETYSHGEKLTLFIDEILKKTEIEIHKLNAVSISSGPGSYTGLRIGTSVAKGICYSLGIPLIAIDSLKCIEEIARNKYPKETIVPMIDARRMEVFCSIHKNSNTASKITATILNEESFKDLEPFIICGDGSEKLINLWQDRNVTIDNSIISSAKSQSKLAWEKFKKLEFENLAYFEPFYLKDFIQC